MCNYGIKKVGVKLKILLVNKYHYRRGGSETYYFALADALRKAGNQVIFFAMNDDKNEPCEQEEYFTSVVDYSRGGKVKQLKQAVTLVYSFEAKRKFEQLVKVEKPDIVHMNLVHRQITLSIVDVCYKYHIPVVYTVHDLVCSCPVGSLLTPTYKTCRKCYDGHYINCVKNKCIKKSATKSFAAFLEANFYKLHHSYDKIDAYITPSFFYKKEIEKSRITTKPIYHLTNFLPSETVYTQAESEEKYFLFLGSLSKNKGVFTLLKAFHRANLSGWKLLYAGTGEETERMTAYIEKNSLHDCVKLLGFITGEALRRVVELSYVAVLPSEWYENGPYALMEPMMCGKPVIGADIGGIPELVIPGKTGWLFESGNTEQLSQVLQIAAHASPKEYTRLSNGAYEFAKINFNEDTYVGKLTKIYENLMEKKK